MSSSRINLRGRSLLRHAVPYWACCIIFFFAAFLAVLLVLRGNEQEKARQLLQHYKDMYIQKGVPGLQLSNTPAEEDSTGFLRLEGPNLRLVLITDSDHKANRMMPDFSSFHRSANLVWHALQPNMTRGIWTTAAALLDNNTTLQIGINSENSLQLLQKIGVKLLQTAAFFLPFCLVPAWFSSHRDSVSMSQVTEQINTMADKATQKIQITQKMGPEEAELIKAVNRLLAHQQKLAGELQESMDNVAHDLRTPITRLRSIAEYGLHKRQDSEHLCEALTDCLEESDRLLSMLNTMLNVAEAEADTVKLDLQPIPLTDSINDVLDLYSIIAEDQGVDIHFSPRSDLIILADRQRISQVWANLLDNAIKYNATEISISTHKQGGMAQIDIRDNGMGISENEIEQIWNRLFRGDRSRSKPGLGLGLTLVRATVNSHNGTIEVDSTLNQGTTFTVRLPLA